MYSPYGFIPYRVSFFSAESDTCLEQSAIVVIVVRKIFAGFTKSCSPHYIGVKKIEFPGSHQMLLNFNENHGFIITRRHSHILI